MWNKMMQRYVELGSKSFGVYLSDEEYVQIWRRVLCKPEPYLFSIVLTVSKAIVYYLCTWFIVLGMVLFKGLDGQLGEYILQALSTDPWAKETFIHDIHIVAMLILMAFIAFCAVIDVKLGIIDISRFKYCFREECYKFYQERGNDLEDD